MQLTEGIERRPKACELGPYAEFVLYQDDLPLLRRFNREGIIHWLANKNERSTGVLASVLQFQTLNKAYYSNRKPVEDRGWHEWPVDHIPVFMGTVFLTMMLILWG